MKAKEPLDALQYTLTQCGLVSMQTLEMLELLEQHLGALSSLLQNLQQHTQKNALVLNELKNTPATEQRSIAILAHQLRTPLAATLLYASSLNHQAISEEQRSEFTQKILDRLQHLQNMIDQMQAFSMGKALDAVWFDAKPWLDRYLGCLRPLFHKHHVALVLQYGWPKQAQFCMDDVHFSGALTNILENALEVSMPGQWVVLRFFVHEEHLSIEIEDQGPGIAEDMLSKVFYPFFTTRPSGMGLGLAIARQVAEKMGGSLSYRSAQTGGACFRFELPRACLCLKT